MKLIAFFLFCVLLVASVFAQQECPTICTSEYRPVCAKNSAGELKTFATKCTLRAENCLRKTDYELEREGAC